MKRKKIVFFSLSLALLLFAFIFIFKNDFIAYSNYKIEEMKDKREYDEIIKSNNLKDEYKVDYKVMFYQKTGLPMFKEEEEKINYSSDYKLAVPEWYSSKCSFMEVVNNEYTLLQVCSGETITSSEVKYFIYGKLNGIYVIDDVAYVIVKNPKSFRRVPNFWEGSFPGFGHYKMNLVVKINQPIKDFKIVSY